MNRTSKFVSLKKTDGHEILVRPYSVTAIAGTPSGATEIVVLGGATYMLSSSMQDVLDEVDE